MHGLSGAFTYVADFAWLSRRIDLNAWLSRRVDLNAWLRRDIEVNTLHVERTGTNFLRM